MTIAGYCPMGCGETLVVGEDGCPVCTHIDCSRPGALTELLENDETEHVVTIREDGFTVEHPLRERLDGALHECKLHQDLQGADGPPEEPGRYRVVSHQPDAVSESYRLGPVGAWDFEAVS